MGKVIRNQKRNSLWPSSWNQFTFILTEIFPSVQKHDFLVFMTIYIQFRVIWSKSHVDTFSSFHVKDEQKKKHFFRYVCIDLTVQKQYANDKLTQEERCPLHALNDWRIQLITGDATSTACPADLYTS